MKTDVVNVPHLIFDTKVKKALNVPACIDAPRVRMKAELVTPPFLIPDQAPRTNAQTHALFPDRC